MASISHAADHAFHKHSQQCDSFSPFDHGASLLKNSQLCINRILGTPTAESATLSPAAGSLYQQAIRAPPRHSPA